MIITGFAKMRLPTTAALGGYLLAVLLASSLGACQRASYQFQPVAGAGYQMLTPLPEPESATITVVAHPSALSAKSYQPVRRNAHCPVRRPHRVRGQAPALPMVLAARAAASVAVRAPQQQPELRDKPVRHRSRLIAILLAALSITYLPLSLHNFYLGYYGRGAAAIGLVVVGLSLVVIGFLGSVYPGTGLVVVGIIGTALLGGWFVWQIADLIRIISRDLQPKDGEYS